MDSCKEIDVSNDMLILEDLLNLDCSFESYEDLQLRYTSLHVTYMKEVENSRKVKKSLDKCLKFYAKLCKKFQAQQKVIQNLEKTINEKMACLEESYKNQEKLKGLIDVYKTERSLYSGDSYLDLKRDKELLLDICCQLISESVKTNNIKNLTNLILRKFKKDLNCDKLNLLKCHQISVKKETSKTKESSCCLLEDLKPLDLPEKVEEEECNKVKNLKHEDNFKEGPSNFNNLQNENGVLETGEETSKVCVASSKEEIELMNSSDEEMDISEEEEAENNVNEKTKGIENTQSQKDILIHEKETIEYCLPVLVDDMETVSESQGSREIIKEEETDCDTQLMPNNTSAECRNKTFSVSHTDKRSEHDFAISSGNKSCLPQNECKTATCESLSKNQSGSKKSEPSTTKLGAEKCELEETIDNHLPALAVPVATVTDFDLNERELDTDKILEKTKLGCPNNENSQIIDSKELKLINCEDSNINCMVNGGDKTHLNQSECVALPSKGFVSNVKQTKFSIFDLSEHQQTSNSEMLESQNTQYLSVAECNHVGNVLRSSSNGTIEFSFKTKLINTISSEDSKSTMNDGTHYVVSRSASIDLLCETEETFRSASIEIKEEELSRIFEEMACVRLLSPIRDIRGDTAMEMQNNKNSDLNFHVRSLELNQTTTFLNSDHRPEMVLGKRRDHCTSDTSRSKKFKAVKMNENHKQEANRKENFIGSIMSAMTKQTMEFKSCNFNSRLIPNSGFRYEFSPSTNQSVIEMNACDSEALPEGKAEGLECSRNPNPYPCEISKTNRGEMALKSVIQKFVSSSFPSKEDAEKRAKECISVLANGSDDLIARIIVGMVFENINEKIQERERPVPPLTNTQYHLIILLSILMAHDGKRESIIATIQSEILRKLFPDTFLWPDDAVETVARFYTALCKNRGDLQTCWKFCLEAMTEMQQRACLVVFVALSTWPDILHKASALKNNILALTVVNIFLHMAKDSRKPNQFKKLLGLKHMLREFYEFKMEDTIEKYTENLLELFYKNEMAADKSIILLSKVRASNWSRKHILSKLCLKLNEWKDNVIGDFVGFRILGVLKQVVVTIFSTKVKIPATEIHDVLTCLSNLLLSQKLNHESEQKVIEVLLNVKQFRAVRKTIAEWKPRETISESLKTEIVNMVSEDILREQNPNRRKDELEGKILNKRPKVKWSKGKLGGGGKKGKTKSKKNKKKQKKLGRGSNHT